MKVFGLFCMFACYACTILTTVTIAHNIAFVHEYANAVLMAIMGGAMFFIARYLHWEWREGKL